MNQEATQSIAQGQFTICDYNCDLKNDEEILFYLFFSLVAFATITSVDLITA